MSIDPKPERVAGYRRLVRRFGEGSVGDAIVAKWRSDPDGGDAFERLLVAVVDAGEPTRRNGNDPRALTPCELRAVRLLANGLREKEIASVLGRSVYTIRQQIGSAMDRLHARNAVAVVAAAFRTGQLKPEDIAGGGLQSREHRSVCVGRLLAAWLE